MQFPARLTLILSLLCCAIVCAHAQSSQSAQTIGTGTITGRITVGSKPAQGVTVLLLPSNRYNIDRNAVARATTDADGQFRLMNIAAGRYEVTPVAPALVAPGSAAGFRSQGKQVNLADGETVDKIDFALVRGGVITGRVTDADGRPVISEHPRLELADQSNAQRRPFFYNPGMFETDDRGIYRIYGIPPGRYVVSVGEDTRSGMARISFGRGGFYQRTFYPDVTEQAKATAIEVTEGSEATNVDITLGRRATTYAASGRVIDSETSKPVVNVTMAYGALTEGENRFGSVAMSTRTDAEGRFRIEGLVPGRYVAFTASAEQQQNEDYSLPVPFEITEGDVNGLTVKVRRGSSISGVAVIDGTNNRSVLAKLSQLSISCWLEEEAGRLIVPVYGLGNRINADGSFRMAGLRPGRYRLQLNGWPPPKGFSLVRVERDGMEQRAGIIDVQAGTQVTGVRFVLEYGTGTVRGQVRVENGTLPENARMYISARRPNGNEPSLPGAEVDARGRFVFEALPPGEYQLRLGVGGVSRGGGQRWPVVLQNVNVTNGAETEVTLVLDLSAKSEGKP